MAYLLLKAFSRMVAARRAQHKDQDLSCLDQFLVLAFAQLTTRESLRDIEINLRAQRKHFYHMGLRCKTVSRNTLAIANRVRPWVVFADLAHHLIKTTRSLYAKPASSELASLMGATVYALDSTTIDLCLSIFNWELFRTTKAAIKLHTLQARLHRGWRVLRDEQSVNRLRTTLQAAYVQSLLRYSCHRSSTVTPIFC